ncbi:RING-type domain-containing protein, partial [Durusdinium trenchii]
MEFWTLTGWIIAGVFAVLGAAVFSAFLLPHSYLLQKPEPEDLKAAIERELPEAQPGEGDVCSVCLEGFDVASAKQLKCKHCYHSDCLTSWARSEQRRRQTPHGLVRIVCPLCR